MAGGENGFRIFETKYTKISALAWETLIEFEDIFFLIKLLNYWSIKNWSMNY